MNLGYACINMNLSNQKPKITTNRSMIKRTFEAKGIEYASELGLQNSRDLFKILEWNNRMGIKLFRMSSGMFPWATEYDLKDMPDYLAIKTLLRGAGNYAKQMGIRLTSHPGPFNVLTSPKENVVQNTFADLEMHGEVFDLIGLEHSPYNKINIHCNGVYGDKKSAMDRFCENFKRLSKSVQTRLTVENDDKETMYSVKDLMYIHNKIGIPIVFDYHHHKFCTGDLSEQEALELAISTWPDDIVPVVHYSESRSKEQLDESIKPQAHSDYVVDYIDTYGHNVDIMVEAKHKELAVNKYKELHNAIL